MSKATQDKRYALKYDFKFECSNEGFTKEEIKEKKLGGTDALIIVSILRDGKKAHDGGTSQQIMSIDGQNNGEPIPDTELFTHFSFVAHHLMRSQAIPSWQRQICEKAFEVIKDFVKH